MIKSQTEWAKLKILKLVAEQIPTSDFQQLQCFITLVLGIPIGVNCQNGTVRRIHESFKGTVERITSPRTVSAFKEKGVLSINEYIIAGDDLVSKCATWSCSVVH
ncbi:E2-like enzyme [Datura stramonium]|uniref:E2-like enzyme n=1 Tax=Datura stramonium TaxID=4076 RepID=A0ABS8TBJ5_DATST|nr:E2-like enzyme [Datura stramonium]